MPLHHYRVHSSPHLNALSKALTDSVNALDLAADRDMLVHCFDPIDNPDWAALPAVWHLTDATQIVVNMGRIYETMFATFPGTKMFGKTLPDYARARDETMSWRDVGTKRLVMPSRAMDAALPLAFDSILNPTAEAGHVYDTFVGTRTGRLVNPSAVDRVHYTLRTRMEQRWNYPTPAFTGTMLYNLIWGAVMRECGYSVFNQTIQKAKWFQDANGYTKNVIGVLEELRVEKQQIMRINNAPLGIARRFFRSAIPVTANTRAVIADMTRTVTGAGGATGVSVANIGLNSSLILGRTHVATLMRYETVKIRERVEDYLDKDRLAKMDEIWAEYVDIRDATEDNIMPLIERWTALFPSAPSGRNASSSVASGSSGSTPPPPAGTPDPSEGAGTEDGEGDGTDGATGSDDADSENGEGDGVSDGITGDSSFGNPPPTQNDDEAEADTGKGEKGGVTTNIGRTHNGPDENPDDDDPGNVDGHLDDVDGEGDEVIELPTESAEKDIVESTEDLDPMENVEYEEQDFGPKDLTPSRISYEKSKHRKPMNSAEAIDKGREIEPTGLDYQLANQLSKALENLNVYDRGKFTRPQVTPPGRMKSRAAVQQSAERALRLPPSAKPWARTVRTVDVNPPLTIGVMTDVSGSQGWAEKISAELAWILSHAVSKINGRVACVTFGTGVTITQRPGEKMHNAQVVRADDGGELPDIAYGALDTMLNLVNGTGTRLVFALTDGRFGMGDELEKNAAWVDLLVSKGVHVVWVTPDPTADKPADERERNWGGGSLPLTPHGVIPIRADKLEDALEEYRWGSRRGDTAFEAVVATETKRIITEIGQQITIAVRSGKSAAHR